MLMKTRRDFLQKLAAAGLALPVISSMANSSSTSRLPSSLPYHGPILKVAIMGLGGYGSRVAEAMQDCKKAKITGVISGTPSKVKDWQKKYAIPEKNCYN